MRKASKLYVLLGVLLVVSVAAFAVGHHEEKKEEIKNSGEVILEIASEDVTALSWTNEDGTFTFTKGDTWVYDKDEAFPVNEEKINELLEQFESFAAAFTIENVTNYSQYGLNDPVCKITISAGEEEYSIKLGDFSKMDEQRYISLLDGNVYLAVHDPLDEFDAVLDDLILNDSIPEFDTAEKIEFSGIENYTIAKDKDGKSICDDDLFFADGKPLDSDNVEDYLDLIRSLGLDDYASYNATDVELTGFGMDEPELTVSIDCVSEDNNGNLINSGNLQLYVSRNPSEAAAYDEAVNNGEDTLPSVSCYVRVGQSQIVYNISQKEYYELTAAGYDDLRHQELFTADFDSVTSIDANLEGKNYTFVKNQNSSDDEDAWTYNGKSFDADDLRSAIEDLTASSFTEERISGQKEISMTIHLDNEDYPEFVLTLFRYDGSDCVAYVDGEPVAFVSRDSTVDLIEAVNKLTLGE